MHRRFVFVLFAALFGIAVVARGADMRSYSGTFRVEEAEFTVVGARIRVETPRYAVDMRGLAVTRVTNKRSGVEFCAGDPPGVDEGARLQLRTYRPGIPHPRLLHMPGEKATKEQYGVWGEQRVTVQKLERGVEYRVQGLIYPGEKDKPWGRYEPDAVMGARIEYDPESGDLLFSPFGKSGVDPKHGVYDEGPDHVTFSLGRLRPEIRFLDPSGATYDVETQRSRRRWPRQWKAALAVFEEPEGSCLSIWAEDRELVNGKSLRVGPVTTFATSNADAPYRTDSVEGTTWHLNVYEGWMPAARVYRDYMADYLDLTPLKEQMPRWVQNVRIICWDVYNHDMYRNMIEQGIVPESILDWRTQGWMRGYGKHKLKRPNWPLDNPTAYVGKKNFGAWVEQAQKIGVKSFPYTILFWEQPEPWKKRLGALISGEEGTGRLWWVLYANLVERIVEDYGVAGIYDDVSWVAPGNRDPHGKIDGMNAYQSHLAGRRYLRERLSPVPFMGERQHELTVVSDSIALLWRQGVYHPINSFLFAPYSIRWNQKELRHRPVPHSAITASESLGCVTVAHRGLPSPDERQMGAVLRKRALLFGRELLRPVFPEKWEENVRAYFEGKNGTRYKVLGGNGARFVRMTPDGPETVYRRIHGTDSVRSAGAIRGWVAYSGQKIIGLQPEHWYVLIEGNARPPAVITELPDGTHLSMSKVLPAGWIVRTNVSAEEGTEPPAHLTLKVSAPDGRKLTFLGAEKVEEPGENGSYTVRVGTAGQLACLWDEPRQVQAPLHLTDATLREMNKNGLADAVQVVEKGSGNLRVGMPPTAADYLLRLPETPLKFQARGLERHGQADVTYRVLINGRPVYEQVRKDDEQIEIAASLAPYAGKTVVLTLETRSTGKGRGSSYWHRPRLVKER